MFNQAMEKKFVDMEKRINRLKRDFWFLKHINEIARPHIQMSKKTKQVQLDLFGR